LSKAEWRVRYFFKESGGRFPDKREARPVPGPAQRISPISEFSLPGERQDRPITARVGGIKPVFNGIKRSIVWDRQRPLRYRIGRKKRIGWRFSEPKNETNFRHPTPKSFLWPENMDAETGSCGARLRWRGGSP
jgi:hypothetical protein